MSSLLPPSVHREVSGCSGEDAGNFSSSSSLSSPPSARHLLERLASSTAISRWIELPMICVLGDTSSGKSSLLSQLASVELPCSHRMTTRCPILMQMSRSRSSGEIGEKPPEKLARVSVQWRRANAASSSSSPLPPFEERTLTEANWDELPDAILAAQEHILAHTYKEVSRDVVALHVQGPQCDADLTLLDLPGWVQSTGQDESSSLVEDVGHLVREYLSRSGRRCVFLAVLPANVDYHNFGVLSAIAEHDPKHLTVARTIPVITKPDLIDAGAEDPVVDLLLGRHVSFPLGFHMVKCRGQRALDDGGQSIADSLEDEIRFFNEVEPWKSVTNRKLFGTANLREKLSTLQWQMVQRSLPDLVREIKQQRLAAAKVLEEMGVSGDGSTGSDHVSQYNRPLESPSERRRYYQDLCQSLVHQVQSRLSGRGTPNSGKLSAAAALHESCNKFMVRIKEGSLYTVRRVAEGSHVLVTTPRGTVPGEVVHLDEDFACVDYVREADRQSKALFEYAGLVAEEPLEEDSVWSDGGDNGKVYIARKDNVFDSLKKIPLASIRTDPAWLKDRIARNRTDDLACFLNVDIFKNLVEEFIAEEWEPHCLELLDRTRQVVLAAILESLDGSSLLNRERCPDLRSLVENKCLGAARELFRQALDQLKSHLEIEKHPYTQDHSLFDSIARARHQSLKRELEVVFRLEQQGVFDTSAIQSILDDVFERSHQKDVEDHLAEEFETVLDSYGQIATRRVIDRVPMICWQVVRGVPGRLQESLGSVADEVLQASVKESSDFWKRYESKRLEVDELNKALEMIESSMPISYDHDKNRLLF